MYFGSILRTRHSQVHRYLALCVAFPAVPPCWDSVTEGWRSVNIESVHCHIFIPVP